jgi:hypothetical protein
MVGYVIAVVARSKTSSTAIHFLVGKHLGYSILPVESIRSRHPARHATPQAFGTYPDA